MYYIIKRKTETRWTAYDIPAEQLENLKSGYEYKGPYTNLVAAMAAANDDEPVADAIEKATAQPPPPRRQGVKNEHTKRNCKSGLCSYYARPDAYNLRPTRGEETRLNSN